MRHAARSTVMVLALSLTVAGPAAAQGPGDFFAALFGGFLRPKPPPAMMILPGMPPDSVPGSDETSRGSGRGVAYCVRMCDGRYFPLSNTSEWGAQTQCAALCPKAETQVFRGGSSIDYATSESGRSYSAIPNAYLYRTKLDAACTCTGSGPLGVASIPIKDDPTLRRGDVVMTPEGARIFDAKSSSPPHQDSAFVPVDKASRLAKDMRQRIEDLRIAGRGGPAD
ncbi:DUF2865 domain-containing protein [Aquabacter sp. CN5-332]|uniref:DUF2865 domain-containing protein n=1 Tax=Aquabacter sp. CN5-332 TaxID=3156608 RepID=UPI0032B50C77